MILLTGTQYFMNGDGTGDGNMGDEDRGLAEEGQKGRERGKRIQTKLQ